MVNKAGQNKPRHGQHNTNVLLNLLQENISDKFSWQISQPNILNPALCQWRTVPAKWQQLECLWAWLMWWSEQGPSSTWAGVLRSFYSPLIIYCLVLCPRSTLCLSHSLINDSAKTFKLRRHLCSQLQLQPATASSANCTTECLAK